MPHDVALLALARTLKVLGGCLTSVGTSIVLLSFSSADKLHSTMAF